MHRCTDIFLLTKDATKGAVALDEIATNEFGLVYRRKLLAEIVSIVHSHAHAHTRVV